MPSTMLQLCRASRMALLVATTACLATVHALAPLTPCESGGRGGRMGLCVGADPIILRGSNYIRLNQSYHSTFDAGIYNRTMYLAAFRAMQASGFNINRVFLDELPNRGIGGSTDATAPLDSSCVDRIAQYITDAESYGIYTILTMVYVPNNAYFRNFSSKFPPLEPKQWDSSSSKVFLTSEGHATFAEYASQLALALKTRLTPAAQAAVLVSLQNEFFLDGNSFPFDSNNITVKLADGVTYDMSSARDRQQAADSNTNLWAQLARTSVRTHLPTSLVFVGVFTFAAVGKKGPNGLIQAGCGSLAGAATTSHHGLSVEQHLPHESAVDCRFPARPVWLARSGVDFLDVHIYQADGSAGALAANLETEEWSDVQKSVPVIMGEFGCNKAWYSSATECAPHVRDLQVSSCAQGFSGWLFWTFDCDEQPGWYTMIDDGGAIGRVLSPNVNADPCKQTTV